MKICHFKHSDGLIENVRLGIIQDDHIIDVNYVWFLYFQNQGFYDPAGRANHHAPSKLSEFLRVSTHPLEKLQSTLDLYNKLKAAGSIVISFNLAKTKLAKPLDAIPTYRDFFTHEKHVKTGFEKRGEPLPEDWYKMPVYYKGSTANFIGPDEEIIWPSFTDKLDYELELAAVMSHDAYNIKENDVYKKILGFTILNDISARDIQRQEMKVRLGPSKGKDFCSVIGPVITTIDEFNFTDPNLTMTAKVNGVEWSRGHSGDAHYSFAQMIAFAGKEEWLLAGDLMGSGTVGTGCGLELDKWLKPGDEIELEIEKIGKLKNKVGHKRT